MCLCLGLLLGFPLDPCRVPVSLDDSYCNRYSHGLQQLFAPRQYLQGSPLDTISGTAESCQYCTFRNGFGHAARRQRSILTKCLRVWYDGCAQDAATSLKNGLICHSAAFLAQFRICRQFGANTAFQGGFNDNQRQRERNEMHKGGTRRKRPQHLRPCRPLEHRPNQFIAHNKPLRSWHLRPSPHFPSHRRKPRHQLRRGRGHQQEAKGQNTRFQVSTY